jgi:polyhydroxyalkanoate synthase
MIRAKEQQIGLHGILPGREMAGVFSSLRANDMIWQYVVSNYLKGESPTAFDLLYWNADPTNQSGPFLIWYLRNMYLENNLRIPGKLCVCGVNIDLGRIDIPTFVLATREDHIVPWQSAYRSARLLKGKVKFVLGASGHVAGVVNPARANKRSHWLGDAIDATPEQWLEQATEFSGSWWKPWSEWLKSHGGKTIAARKRLGNTRHKPLADAPGAYVMEKSTS